MVPLKSSNDNDKPHDVDSGFPISNFKLGCTLFITAKTPLLKKTYIPARAKTTKALMSRLL